MVIARAAAILAISLLALAAAETAQAQGTAPPSSPYVYDTSNVWGLSSAGVPPGPYFKAGIGKSWTANSKFDDSYVAGGGLGYRFAPWFRSDVTFDYRPDFTG